MLKFRKVGEFVINYRFLVILFIAAVTVFFGYQAISLKMALERKSQLPQSHPFVKLDNRIADIFGGANVVVIAIEKKEGDIFNQDTLIKIRWITEEVMKLKGVIKSNVLSIASPMVKHIKGSEGSVEIGTLLKDLPVSGEEMEELKRRVYDNEMSAFIISKDGRAASIIADFKIDRDFSETFIDIDRVLEKVRDNAHHIYLGGPVVTMHFLQVYSKKMIILFLFTLAMIGLIHYEAFRTVQAIILPLLTALLSVVWGLGILGFFGIPMDVWNSMTPILILSVAAGHAVQILKRYYEEYRHCGDNRLAVIEAISKVGPTMIITGVATIIGFLSLMVFDIRTVRVFGLFTALGIFSALVLEMTFIPAIRSLLPPPSKGVVVKENKKMFLDRFLQKITIYVMGRPKWVAVTALIILSIVIISATRIELNNSFIEAFPKKDKIRIDEDFINERFAGTSTMNILIEGTAIDSLKAPEILEAMDRLQKGLEDDTGVGRTISLTNFIKRMNMAMNGDNKEFYHIPKDSDLVAQYLFLYGPDDLDIVVDRNFQNGVVRVFTKTDHAAFSNIIFSKAEALASNLFDNLNVKASVAGGSLGTLRALNDNVIHEKIQNIWQVSAIIFLIASLALRSFVGGLYIITPSLLAVAINFGFMGITGIWLSLSTAAVSALTISIGSDYAFYFIFRYREEFKKWKDHKIALKETMLTSGKAIFFVSSAIAVGFAVLLFSGLIYHRHLGGLVALSMITSSLGAVTILPTMITLFKPKFVREINTAVATLQVEKFKTEED